MKWDIEILSHDLFGGGEVMWRKTLNIYSDRKAAEKKMREFVRAGCNARVVPAASREEL